MLETFHRIAGFEAGTSWTFWAVLISLIYLFLSITSLISAYRMYADDNDFDETSMVIIWGRILAMLIFISWLIQN